MRRRVAPYRPSLSFRAVNRRGYPGFDPRLQRHHVLPRQLLSEDCLATMFAQIDTASVGFEDFRRNGLLLPSTEVSALRTGMPLHRGPHREYNAMVIARVGAIERRWSATRRRFPIAARDDAVSALRLLQRALRRQLLDPIGRRLRLNRRDPLDRSLDYTQLDAMADAIWADLERDPF